MTYSIVARDERTGELGVAVQSHWFSVGSVVTWARPGVGAAATQANALAAHGPRAIEQMAAGLSAQQALEATLALDELARTRQVAAVDARGGAAAHTGADCIPFAGHVTGPGVSCQANIMASPTVWGAMLETYNAHSGPLAERLLAALQAAEAEGGDIRGRQSAALLVVPAHGEWWERSLELRVEDHPEPLAEMRRLIDVSTAYDLAGQAEEIADPARHAEAAALFERAAQLGGENHELLFWAGLGKVHAGDTEAGLTQLRRAIALQPGWADLLTRIPESVAPGGALAAELLATSNGAERSPVTVHLVRHGQTDWNLQQRLQGQSDIPLNDTGRQQALEAARQLQGRPIGAVISSDLSRAVDTARPIAEQFGLPLVTDPALRERGFGSVEGRAEPELLEEMGEPLLRYWSEPDLAFSGGETRRDTYDRARGYLQQLLAQPPAAEIVIVSHGGTLNLIRGYLEGLAVEDVPRYGFQNGSVTTLLVQPGSLQASTVASSASLSA